MSLVMNWHHTFWMCSYVSGGIGELTFHVQGNQLRGTRETSSLEGKAGLVLLLVAKSVAMSLCNMLSSAFSKCFLSPSQGALLHGEDGKAEPWKAPQKSAVSEEKPKLSPWHTVLILNMLWRLSKKGVCLENTKLYNEGQSVICQEDTLHETAFSVQVKSCARRNNLALIFMCGSCAIYSFVLMLQHVVTTLEWWAVFLGFCKEYKMKCFLKNVKYRARRWVDEE